MCPTCPSLLLSVCLSPLHYLLPYTGYGPRGAIGPGARRPQERGQTRERKGRWRERSRVAEGAGEGRAHWTPEPGHVRGSASALQRRRFLQRGRHRQGMVWYGVAGPGMVLHGVVWCGVVVRYGMVRWGRVERGLHRFLAFDMCQRRSRRSYNCSLVRGGRRIFGSYIRAWSSSSSSSSMLSWLTSLLVLSSSAVVVVVPCSHASLLRRVVMIYEGEYYVYIYTAVLSVPPL